MNINLPYQKAIREKIKNCYSQLTNTEKYVADIIYDNPSFLQNHTLDAISQKLSASQSSIYRFIQKIGFSNIFELKHWIVEKNLEDLTYIPLVIDIQQTLINFAIKKPEPFLKLFSKTNKIFISANGSSKPLAYSLERKLSKLNLNAKFVLASDCDLYLDNPEAIWIFVSISGKSFDSNQLKIFKFPILTKRIMFSAIPPPLNNLKNFTYNFYSHSKRDFSEVENHFPLDSEILCLTVINKFIETISYLVIE